MLVARIEVLGEIDERGSARFTVDHDSTVRGMNGLPVDVVVDNFSRTGLMFTGDADLPVGTLVSIGLGGSGVREAKVVRRDGAEHGCEFLVPLPQWAMKAAFRGQDAMVAEIEAALERPRKPGSVPPEPSPPGARGLLGLIRRR